MLRFLSLLFLCLLPAIGFSQSISPPDPYGPNDQRPPFATTPEGNNVFAKINWIKNKQGAVTDVEVKYYVKYNNPIVGNSPIDLGPQNSPQIYRIEVRDLNEPTSVWKSVWATLNAQNNTHEMDGADDEYYGFWTPSISVKNYATNSGVNEHQIRLAVYKYTPSIGLNSNTPGPNTVLPIPGTSYPNSPTTSQDFGLGLMQVQDPVPSYELNAWVKTATLANGTHVIQMTRDNFPYSLPAQNAVWETVRELQLPQGTLDPTFAHVLPDLYVTQPPFLPNTPVYFPNTTKEVPLTHPNYLIYSHYYRFPNTNPIMISQPTRIIYDTTWTEYIIGEQIRNGQPLTGPFPYTTLEY